MGIGELAGTFNAFANGMEEAASSHLGQSRDVPSIYLAVIEQCKEKFLGWETIDSINIHIRTNSSIGTTAGQPAGKTSSAIQSTI